MKTRIRSIGFLVSLVLHAVFVWLLYGSLVPQEYPKIVEVEYFDIPARVVKDASSQPGSKRGTGKSISRQRLFPSSSPIGRPSVSTPTITGGVGVLDDNHQYNEAMTEIFGENVEWPFLRYLHQKVEEELSFDRVLAEWNHFGTVYVEFWVDDQGLLIPNRFRVMAEDPILKVHSLRALRRALNKPFDELKRNPLKESIKVHAKFDYLFGAAEVEKQKAFSKRNLVFQRRTTVNRIPTEFWQQVGDGGINTDLVVMYNKWKKYNKKKSQIYTGFDPFDDYRKDPDFNL